ncbi:DEAD/DEAH box helicase [Weissella cibaria]|uniref:DEAD/DEAH box helicase n=1 Tax=Weissella cibaria TaxID=137591 RepID=UPI001CC4DB2A|nr:DEAD/DEAH box helicase [Weissella cibaria]MBZ6070362.1 DEAD/DEAH box helicase [Weissella cibaria]HJF37318.1 DEAD/DEAH box helicase [Weissella cibaria]
MNSKPVLKKTNVGFQLVDSSDGELQSSRVQRTLKRYRDYFADFEDLILPKDINYVDLNTLIEKLNGRLNDEIYLEDDVKQYIEQNAYAIDEQRIAGLTIKDYDLRWDDEVAEFSRILNQEISRPLKPQQLQASFYLATMKKAANFSVPGAGKTAMMYGAFAYLSSPEVDQINRLVVVSPINAFEAWRTEFAEVFGPKRDLHFMNLKQYGSVGDVRRDWGVANIIVINYEALSGWKLSALNGLIDEKTMIVFDEVHRIKNPEGKRAANALTLGPNARFHYVLTGTPIPNSYKDVYNFLHLLYQNEYDAFFGWEINELDANISSDINDRLQPFFWRTNKTDLEVPPAEADKLIKVEPDTQQADLAAGIHDVESNVLAKYIRLMQASTNPELLTANIDFNDLGFLFGELDYTVDSAFDSAEERAAKQRLYLDFGVDKMRTPKFDAGMDLIKSLVHEGKKVLVWGMFVGTMHKIQDELTEEGISSSLIYGATPKDDRVDLINRFRDGDVSVLISNPATLGESISLHQTVHDAVYFEYNFNLTFMLQSRDRIHRLGLPANQYTRYYYLITDGDSAHGGFIDQQVYDRLKEKEQVMMKAIDGKLLVPMIEDDYLDDVKSLLK